MLPYAKNLNNSTESCGFSQVYYCISNDDLGHGLRITAMILVLFNLDRK